MQGKSVGHEERYCEWFLCTVCKRETIGAGDNFCSNCGSPAEKKLPEVRKIGCSKAEIIAGMILLNTATKLTYRVTRVKDGVVVAIKEPFASNSKEVEIKKPKSFVVIFPRFPPE